MDSDDEMVEEAVEGTSISVGSREEAPEGARDAEGVAGCDRRGSGPPAAATVPYAGGRVRAGAGRPRPRRRERALSGGAQAGKGAQLGRGPRGGQERVTAAPSCPATACIRPRSCKTCPALRPSPFRGWEMEVRRRSAPPNPHPSRRWRSRWSNPEHLSRLQPFRSACSCDPR